MQLNKLWTQGFKKGDKMNRSLILLYNYVLCRHILFTHVSTPLKEHPEFFALKMVYHCGNHFFTHISVDAKANRHCDLEELNHLPCSLDLVIDLDPSDYILFSKMKSDLRKKKLT